MKITLLGFTGSACLFAAAAGIVRGDTIISDTFTATDTTTLIGRAPDGVDLPGSTYSPQEYPGAYESDIRGNKAQLGADVGVAVSLASSGSYTKPSRIILSTTLNEGTEGDEGGYTRVVALGFYNSSIGTGNNGFLHFTGLALNSVGRLELLSNGGDTGLTAAYAGRTFDPAVDHTLSYAINTTTGAISEITLDGLSELLSGSTSVFTDAATAYAGFYGSGTAGGQFSQFDNFTVVPEPASLAMLACASMGLLTRRCRG